MRFRNVSHYFWSCVLGSDIKTLLIRVSVNIFNANELSFRSCLQFFTGMKNIFQSRYDLIKANRLFEVWVCVVLWETPNNPLDSKLVFKETSPEQSLLYWRALKSCQARPTIPPPNSSIPFSPLLIRDLRTFK